MASYATRFSILALVLVALLGEAMETGQKLEVGVCGFSDSDFVEQCGGKVVEKLRFRCGKVAGGSKRRVIIGNVIKAWENVLNSFGAMKPCRTAAIGYLHDQQSINSRRSMI